MVVETAKWAEDEDALIVRLYEAEGGTTPARRSASASVPQRSIRWTCSSATPARFEATASVPLEFRAREIKTVRVRLPDA